jgi:hypothetical protein
MRAQKDKQSALKARTEGEAINIHGDTKGQNAASSSCEPKAKRPSLMAG